MRGCMFKYNCLLLCIRPQDTKIVGRFSANGDPEFQALHDHRKMEKIDGCSALGPCLELSFDKQSTLACIDV